MAQLSASDCSRVHCLRQRVPAAAAAAAAVGARRAAATPLDAQCNKMQPPARNALHAHSSRQGAQSTAEGAHGRLVGMLYSPSSPQ